MKLMKKRCQMGMKMGILFFMVCLFFAGTLPTAHAETDKLIQLKKPITFLFVDSNGDGQLDTSEFLVIIAADDYKSLFKCQVPLERMLRSQIQGREFIVLNHDDFKEFDKNHDGIIDHVDGEHFYKIYFAKLGGRVKGDYVVTTAEFVDLGKLNKIVLDFENKNKESFTKKHKAHFHDGKKVPIGASDNTMHWIGL